MSRVGVRNFNKRARAIADRAMLAIGAAIMLLPGIAMAQDATTTAPAADAAAPAAAAAAPVLNAGDTAWMLTSTALVLMMTMPGLALFYGGMVRKMNVLATIMQSFAITCLVTVVWIIVGYTPGLQPTAPSPCIRRHGPLLPARHGYRHAFLARPSRNRSS